MFAPSRRLLVGRVFRTGPASVDYGSLNLTFQSVCAWGRRAPSLRARKWSGQAIATGPSEKPRAVKHCPRKTKHIGICRAERERVGGYPPARLWGGPSACSRWSTSLRPRRRPLRESKCRGTAAEIVNRDGLVLFPVKLTTVVGGKIVFNRLSR